MNWIVFIFALNVGFAQQVEIKLPEFSEKVQEQGKEKPKVASDHCTADSQSTNAKLTCGLDKPAATGANGKLGELGGENSQYATDQVRQNSRKR